MKKKLTKAFWKDLLEHGDKLKVEYADFSIIDNKSFKNLRNDLNLTQNKFANILGVSKKTIEKWEQGTNPIKGAASRLIYLLIEDNSLIERLYKSQINKAMEMNDVMHTITTFKEVTNILFDSFELVYDSKRLENVRYIIWNQQETSQYLIS